MTYLTEKEIQKLKINELYSFDLEQEEFKQTQKDDSYKIIFSFGTECNLSCSYCYEKNSESKCITFDEYKSVLNSFDFNKHSSLIVEFIYISHSLIYLYVQFPRYLGGNIFYILVLFNRR